MGNEEVRGLSREEKLWAAWFVGTVGSFIYLEAKAIRTQNGRGTLTASTRRVLGLHPPKPWRFVGAAGFTAFFGWLTAHIVTGDFVPAYFAIKEQITHEGGSEVHE